MNKLKSIALIIEEINDEKLSKLLVRFKELGVEELKLFTNSKSLISSSLNIETLPLRKGREILFEKFKALALEAKDKGEDIKASELKVDLDLIIKVGTGLESLEDSLISEASYAEIHFAKKEPKDFSLEDLNSAIEDYLNRKRNFGV